MRLLTNNTTYKQNFLFRQANTSLIRVRSIVSLLVMFTRKSVIPWWLWTVDGAIVNNNLYDCRMWAISQQIITSNCNVFPKTSKCWFCWDCSCNEFPGLSSAVFVNGMYQLKQGIIWHAFPYVCPSSTLRLCSIRWLISVYLSTYQLYHVESVV